MDYSIDALKHKRLHFVARWKSHSIIQIAFAEYNHLYGVQESIQGHGQANPIKYQTIALPSLSCADALKQEVFF